jgi:curved DNA-binding protein CbpA
LYLLSFSWWVNSFLVSLQFSQNFHPIFRTQASDEDIRRAYRKLALRWHPDKHLHDPAEAGGMFQQLNAAYEVLRQPKLRRQYDELLLHKMFMEDYLQRYYDLILTAQGLGLPLSPKKGELASSSSSSSSSSSGGMYNLASSPSTLPSSILMAEVEEKPLRLVSTH